MYYFIYFLLALLFLYELLVKKINRYLFVIIFISIAVILALRYGQGTDYFNYKDMYENTGVSFSLLFNNIFSGTSENGELLYNAITILFRNMNLSFEVFISFISIFQMLCLYRFITKFTQYGFVAIFIFYSTYWHYFDSTIRQGIAIGIILGFACIFYQNSKPIKMFVSIIISALFHTSAILFLLIYFVNKKKTYSAQGVGITISIGLIFSFTHLLNKLILFLPTNLQNRVLPYISDSEASSILAILNRIIIFAIILFLYTYIGKSVSSKIYYALINFYVVGFIIFIFTMNSALIASRITIYFRIIEIVLIPILFSELKIIRNKTIKLSKIGDIYLTNYILAITLVIILSINWFKNVDSWLTQADYKDKATFSYEYTSIFNENRIYVIREDAR